MKLDHTTKAPVILQAVINELYSYGLPPTRLLLINTRFATLHSSISRDDNRTVAFFNNYATVLNAVAITAAKTR